MQIYPDITLTVATELQHGQPVILDSGRIGLVWQFTSQPRRRFVVSLDDFSVMPIEGRSLSQIYIPVLQSAVNMRLFTGSLTYHERSARPGDVMISSIEGCEGYFLILRDPIENGLSGFSFDDASKAAHISHGYVALFQSWAITVDAQPEPIVLVSRAPPDTPSS